MLLSFGRRKPGSRSAHRSILSKNLKLVRVSVLFFVFSPSLTAAQQIPDQAEDVIRVRTDLVTVPAVVIDSHGQRVFGLAQQDFAVRSDNNPVKLDFFSAGTDHVALAFLLDASGSARDYVLHEREAALSLFSRFGPGSEIAVLRFGEKVEIAAPFTREIDEVRSGFEFPAVSNRGTAIFDAALTALRLFAKRKGAATERRIIILTSDGLDTASKTKAAEVIQRAQQEGISFYVIHFPIFSPRDGHLAPRPTTKGFRDLAEKTGGRYFLAGDAKSALAPQSVFDLSPLFRAIEEDLSSQYVLGFYPDEASRDGYVHRVEVTLIKRTRGYRVKTLREQYTLQKQ